MVFSAKDFSTNLAVGSGINSAVVSGEGTIAVSRVLSFIRNPLIFIFILCLFQIIFALIFVFKTVMILVV